MKPARHSSTSEDATESQTTRTGAPRRIWRGGANPIALSIFLMPGLFTAAGNRVWPGIGHALTSPATTTMVGSVSGAVEPAAVSDRDDPYDAIRVQGEKLYAEKSYAMAHGEYEKALKLDLTSGQKRWVEFRLADTQWRSEKSSQNADASKVDGARKELDALIAAIDRPEVRDLVWAEAQESLGDLANTAPWNQGEGEAWNHYALALDYWANSTELDTARRRYLGIIWKTAPLRDIERYRSNLSTPVPTEILAKARSIAQSPEDIARTQLLLALALRRQAGSPDSVIRTSQAFDEAIQDCKGQQTYYDDALFYAAQWYQQTGRMTTNDDGSVQLHPDHRKALELYQTLTSTFERGQSPWWDEAKRNAAWIVSEEVSINVGNTLLPGSEAQIYCNWRNTKQVTFSLYKVDLAGSVNPEKIPAGNDWLSGIDLSEERLIKKWTKETGDEGLHEGGDFLERVPVKLDTGAYIMLATGDTGVKNRALLLVSDLALVLKTSVNETTVYVCDAITGQPVAGAKVTDIPLVYETKQGSGRGRWVGKRVEGTTDSNGLAVLKTEQEDRPRYSSEGELIFASTDDGGRQTFVMANRWWGWYGRNDRQKADWRIYAYTDRPVYRPEDTVKWKMFARIDTKDGYTTPAHQKLKYTITDAQGAIIRQDTIELNDYGSAWGEVPLNAKMPLGEFTISFETPDGKDSLGSAALFRLEEYKLPEFEVTIETPKDEMGRPKRLRLGDEVQAVANVQYYFGGPVAEAQVHFLVSRQQFVQDWQPVRGYPWLYQDDGGSRWGRYNYYPEQTVLDTTVKTDATGKATVTFPSEGNLGYDLEYHIEARVTDSSRREVTGTGDVRVTQHSYFMHATAQREVAQPGGKVEITFSGKDANDNPAVGVEGQVTVYRQRWDERWVTPAGAVIEGDEIDRLYSKYGFFPPPTQRGDRWPWRRIRGQYQREKVTTSTLKLNDKGESTFTFTPEKQGYYEIEWYSPDPPMAPVNASCTVFVGDHNTQALGCHTDQVQIFLEKDTARLGDELPVVISTPTSNRWVLFTVEGDDLYQTKVIHVEGNVKFINLPIDRKYLPNVYLHAVMVTGGFWSQDQKEIVIPPVEQFINVAVHPESEKVMPGSEGSVTVTTTDADGKPISAEVSMSVFDASTLAIQSDLAPDPREFFYSQRQSNRVQTISSFSVGAYIRLIERADGQLVDQRLAIDINAGLSEQEAAAGANGPRSNSRRSELAFGGRGGSGNLFKDEESPSDKFGLTMESKSVPSRMLADAAAPASPAAPEPGQAPGHDGEATIQVRSDFRATAVWQPDVVTDAKTGKATITFKYPESLTRWQAVAKAVTTGSMVGIGDAASRTIKPVTVRFQGPRFFTVGDQCALSAIINNNTDKAATVKAWIKATDSGLTLSDLNGSQESELKPVELKLAPGAEQRIDWQAHITGAGDKTFTVYADAGKGQNDAMDRTLHAYEHGIERFIARTGKVRDAHDVTVLVNLPKERRAGSTSMTVQVTPSMAVTMLDSLPYLVSYPYGCTEQTMSRFLPTLTVIRTLADLGLSKEQIANHIFGGIDPAFADKTNKVPHSGLDRLQDVVDQSLDRLASFQHGDGGWGWWKEGQSDPWMTSYVLWGLSMMTEGRAANQDVVTFDVNRVNEMMGRAVAYLTPELVRYEKSPDMQAWMLSGLSAASKAPSIKFNANQRKMIDTALSNTFAQREKLNAYTRALLGIAEFNFGRKEEAQVLVRNMANGVQMDDQPDQSVLVKGDDAALPANAVVATAHWGNDGIYWRWSDSGIESTATTLRAMLLIDPQNKLIEPTVNWLLKNRRGAHWTNTRDTALCVLALCDYLKVSGELGDSAATGFVVNVNGKDVATIHLTREQLLSAPSRVSVPADLIRDGENKVTIRRTEGAGPVYFAVQAEFFSLEEPIPAGGTEIFVRRDYFRLVPVQTLLEGKKYQRVILHDGDQVSSGDRIEEVLTIEAKNDYEYLVFEDHKPAGLEAVELKSGEGASIYQLREDAVKRLFAAGGERIGQDDALRLILGYDPATGGDGSNRTGRSAWVHQEWRDTLVGSFVSQLPQGVWQIRYEMRAEVPGIFHGLPVVGHAMYVPEIRCNSHEMRLSVREKEGE